MKVKILDEKSLENAVLGVPFHPFLRLSSLINQNGKRHGRIEIYTWEISILRVVEAKLGAMVWPRIAKKGKKIPQPREAGGMRYGGMEVWRYGGRSSQ